MRQAAAVLLVAAIAGCATGGGIFPEAGEPNAAIAGAERMIGEAQGAGADSLAPTAMAIARQHLADARAASGSRAALKGRQAQAAARFARVEATRVLAVRAQAQAEQALAAVRPGGNP